MSKRRWLAITILVDAALINAAIILAFLIRFGGKPPPFNFQAYTSLAVLISLVQLGALYIYDLYNPEKTQSSWDIFFSLLKAVTLGLIFITALSFVARLFSFPRTVLLLSWLLLILILTGWRALAPKVLKIKFPSQRVLVVGTGDFSKEILKELKRRAPWGYEVAGLAVKKPERLRQKIHDIPVLGTIQEIPSLVRKHHINRVIITTPLKKRELIEDLAHYDGVDVKVEVVPELYEIFVGKMDHTLISDIPLMELTKEPVPDWVRLSKRLLDIILAFTFLVITSPLIVLAVLAIKITSRGPVIYRQKRVGQKEKLFNMHKFRTMVVGAEEETGPVLATETDPRITIAGRFLRRYRLDELPQLFNILKGDMSFIGPRPERLTFVKEFKKYIPGYSERFRIKPGLTGLAQISASYATTAEKKLKYDLIYIYHQSLLLDLKILLQTLKVVLTGEGAR